MKNIIILSVFLLIMAISVFLIACDDFLSPTIEIFNDTSTPTDVKQEQKKEKQDHSIQQN